MSTNKLNNGWEFWLITSCWHDFQQAYHAPPTDKDHPILVIPFSKKTCFTKFKNLLIIGISNPKMSKEKMSLTDWMYLTKFAIGHSTLCCTKWCNSCSQYPCLIHSIVSQKPAHMSPKTMDFCVHQYYHKVPNFWRRQSVSPLINSNRILSNRTSKFHGQFNLKVHHHNSNPSPTPVVGCLLQWSNIQHQHRWIASHTK